MTVLFLSTSFANSHGPVQISEAFLKNNIKINGHDKFEKLDTSMISEQSDN